MLVSWEVFSKGISWGLHARGLFGGLGFRVQGFSDWRCRGVHKCSLEAFRGSYSGFARVWGPGPGIGFRRV